MTHDPAIIKAAARAVQRKSDYALSNEAARQIATAVLAAVTPLIRAAALEEANWPTNEDVLQDDLRDLLDALGMPSGAQPRSPHEVFRAALARMKRIRADALEEAAKVAENQPSAPLKIGAPQTWMKQQIAAAIRALIKEQP